jgi:hypothetical protein
MGTSNGGKLNTALAALEDMVKGMTDVRAHESHAKDGHVIQVKQHQMTVNKTAMVDAIAKMRAGGEVTTFASKKKAVAHANKTPGAAIFAHRGQFHVAGSAAHADRLSKLGAKRVAHDAPAPGPAAGKTSNAKRAEGKGKPKAASKQAMGTDAPHHLHEAGSQMLAHLRALPPGSPEHGHVLGQYEAVRQAASGWDSSDVRSSVKVKARQASPDGLRSGEAKTPTSVPGFVRGGADKLKTPGHFEVAAMQASTKEEAIALGHHFNAHTESNGHEGPAWDTAWADIRQAVNTLPTEAEVKAKADLAAAADKEATQAQAEHDKAAQKAKAEGKAPPKAPAGTTATEQHAALEDAHTERVGNYEERATAEADQAQVPADEVIPAAPHAPRMAPMPGVAEPEPPSAPAPDAEGDGDRPTREWPVTDANTGEQQGGKKKGTTPAPDTPTEGAQDGQEGAPEPAEAPAADGASAEPPVADDSDPHDHADDLPGTAPELPEGPHDADGKKQGKGHGKKGHGLNPLHALGTAADVYTSILHERAQEGHEQ